MQIPNLDLGVVSGIFNIAAGLATIWLMQCITKQAGFSSAQAWMKGVQRTILAAIALALIWNGGATLDDETEPRVIDLVLELVLLSPLLLFAARHVMAPQINQEVRDFDSATEPAIYRAVWAIWARLCGVGSIALGTAILAAWLLHPSRPVSVYSEKTLLTPTVSVGSQIEYLVTVDRLRNCKGYITDFYTALTRFPPDNYQVQVTLRRPLSTTKAQANLKVHASVVSPRSIVGPAHYRSVLFSACPEGERSDPIVEFDYVAVTE